jgi:hypothetical protein
MGSYELRVGKMLCLLLREQTVKPPACPTQHRELRETLTCEATQKHSNQPMFALAVNLGKGSTLCLHRVFAPREVLRLGRLQEYVAG